MYKRQAYKIQGKSYATGKARTTFFVGAFPHKSPRYIVLLLLDDPKPTKNTYGFAAAGWNAAPTAGKIIERMAPILGLHATEEDSESSQAPKGWVNVSHVTSTHESVNGSE